jgi:hydrogenase maturation protein HypF
VNSLRLKVGIQGAVQGVGFRPFVHRLASKQGLTGWVENSAQGVVLEVEGPRPQLEHFLLCLEADRPTHSFISNLEASWLDTVGYQRFEIRPSAPGGCKTALVLPDVATCPECLGEILDPSNRRYGYPFTNCTHCGPRFSIIESLPYDRANTSMKAFQMCPRCQSEYDDPQDRRFHAQPNACPDCGPQLSLWDPQGRLLASRTRPILVTAAEALQRGAIVAVKGLGGFHLMAAAHQEEAVRRLRERKQREEKPFALMFPSLAAIREHCEVSPLEERLLGSAQAPIVLLRRRRSASAKHPVCASVAPANPYLGAMLPYTPLHHLLLSLLDFPVIATSGNLTDEPICIDEVEALQRLGGIADLFLVHNRPIVRHVDDSVVRVMLDRELVLRRARGYAPLPIQTKSANGRTQNAEASAQAEHPTPILAVGAHLKNTIALAVDEQVFLSQHIGDLETDLAYAAFERVIADFSRLYGVTPAVVAADLHPDYLSTKFARALVAAKPSEPDRPRSPADASDRPVHSRERGPSALSPRLISVQHHLAHVLSCMVENELEPPVLGVAWDGTGYGLDGSIWGGEFIVVTEAAWERVAALRPFRLPGGDQAIKEPRRAALGLLWEHLGAEALARADLAPIRVFSLVELDLLKTMLTRGVNAPLTSSVGRLFDAVASLAGLRQIARFEGQAAMELEFAMTDLQSIEPYPFQLSKTNRGRRTFVLDWAPMLGALLSDLARRASTAEISPRFHHGLAEAIVAVAQQVHLERVVLSGGCFQNARLVELAVAGLQKAGFRPYWHQRVPPNDGGIALGQVLAAKRQGK